MLYLQKKFEDEYTKDKKYRRDYFHDTGEHRGSIHSIYNLMYRAFTYILIVFHNRSSYELAQEFDGQLIV